MIDRTFHWPEVAPVADTLAPTFVDVWAAWFGVPYLLTSDHGVQFTGSLWSQLCAILGIKQQLTTAYRPHADMFGGAFQPSPPRRPPCKTAGCGLCATYPWSCWVSILLLEMTPLPQLLNMLSALLCTLMMAYNIRTVESII